MRFLWFAFKFFPATSEPQSYQQNDSCLNAIHQDQARATCIIKGEEKDEYHWKIIPPPGKGGAVMPSQKKKHEYARLDCTKMEPKNEYTQMNIK